MKKLLFTLSLLLTITCCFFIFNNSNKIEAKNIEAIMNKTYVIGDCLNIPEYTFVEEGKEYESYSYITYPDGSYYRQNQITFEQTGIYTVDYIAKDKTKDLTRTYYITVYESLYHFSNTSSGVKSYAYYGVDNSKYNTGITGLTVKLYSQDVFYFDQVIDLRNCQDNLHCAFMKWFAIPDTMGHFDVERFMIRLTDIYDDSRYLDINIFPYPVRCEPDELPNTATENWKYFDTFISVNGENQLSTGLGWEADGSYRFHQNDLSGFAGAHSMYGYSFRTCSVGQEILDLGLDLDTLEFLSTYRIGGRSSVVADLDDLTYMQNAWAGFTTGEVKMELKAYMYRDAEIPFTFMITDLAGLNLKEQYVVDTDGPEIVVEDNLPQAYVNSYYKVPSVTVTDKLSNVTSVKSAVYYNYGSNTATLLDSYDGYFKPTKAGIYTVEYTASDAFKNTTIKKYKINVVEGNPVDNVVSISTNTSLETYIAGTTVNLPNVTASLNSNIKTYLSLMGENFEYNSEYKFTKVGNYTLSFVVTDAYNRTQIITKQYQITGGNKPVFEADAVLPLCFIEGGTYTIADYFAKEYNGDEVKDVSTIVSVDLGNGYQIIPTRTFKCVADNTDVKEINIRYIASNAYGTTVKVYTIPYVNPIVDDSLHLENMFIGNNIKKEATDDYIEISSVKINKETNFMYANALNAQGLSFGFTIDAAKSNFEAVVITLVDSVDPTISATLTFKKNANGTSDFFFNDKETKTVTGGFKNSTMIMVEYEDATRKLSTQDFSMILKTDSFGKKFNGFTSGKCYMKVELLNVTGSAGIQINKINKQNMSNIDVDYIKPTVAVMGDYEATYAHNEVITVYKAYGTDVIDPSPSCTLTVKNFAGEIITALDGTLLNEVPANKEYQIKLSDYGNYLITYSSKDNSRRSNSFMFVLSVVDNNAPTFNVSDQTFTVNKKQGVNISNINVTDDASTVTLVKRIVYPTGETVIIDNSVLAVSFTKSGTYKVVFVATDVTGNMSSVTYTIIVK